jgi:hypothetical protein
MKNFLKYTLITALLTSGFAFGQTNVNETEIIKTETITVGDKKAFTMKTVSEQLQVIDLEDRDMTKTNQDITASPIMVSKVIWIDSDDDKAMDRIVHMYYSKDSEDALNYLVTAKGITLTSATNKEKYFDTVGTYQVRSKDVGNVLISIDVINQSK